ncbi:hypothetical protein DRH29_02525 [candidate division Kazan bacterium]|uniref:Uncharacterized protein n=1 Tax=candidate division Kazan bacterium TaxID=2202143 RepID=A0A420ZCQ3_UNCK3|nr:MAG: hypothetical protein DRH29_02525 [candidate division Kazan bacterium]
MTESAPETQIGSLIEKISGLMETTVGWLLTAASAIVIIMIIIGGIQYITGQAEAGKKTIIAALIGTVIIVLSYPIITVVINLLSH